MRRNSKGKVLWTFIIPISGSDENSHTTVDISINLRNFWVGISAYELLRPVVFPNRLAGSCTVSLGLLIYQYNWEMCLSISVNTCGSCMMGHHFTVREYLNLTFGGQWIARGGPISWSVRSPVVNSVQLWLWGTQRPSYIQIRWMTERKDEILQQRRKVESCVDQHGNYTENLL
jgi:hypothetical protein